MFAAGTAQGRPWQLSVRDIADPGTHCLPAILLNATDGYLPPAGAGVAGGIASLAFLTSVPGQPGTGYAALRVSPDVTRLTVELRDGSTLGLRPVTVQACGHRLPLAGFSYPESGVATITAYAGTQVLTRVTPPASLFTGAGGYAAAGPPGSAGSTPRLVPGVWQQLWRTQSTVSSGLVASGRGGVRAGWTAPGGGSRSSSARPVTASSARRSMGTPPPRPPTACRSRSRPLAPARCSVS